MLRYKEAIWEQFDTEMKRVLKSDSSLYRQIHATSNVLLECNAHPNDNICNAIKQSVVLKAGF